MNSDSQPPHVQTAQHRAFSPEIALSYARALAHPRRVGSGEDERAAHEIAARLAQFGYHVERQPFRFSSTVNVVIALETLIGLLLIAAALGVHDRLPWISAILAIVLLALLISTGRINDAVRSGAIAPGASEATGWQPGVWTRLGPRLTAVNLIATLPGQPADPSLPHLHLVAHYDSKSQAMPIAARIALFTLTISGTVVFAGLILGGLIVSTLNSAATAAGLIALITGFPLAVLFLVDAGNASPGAIDNASGVGTVLHLAECLAVCPADRLHVTILITSAEELGLMGAAAYVRQYEAALRRQADAGGLFILNFDGVGMEGDLYYTDAYNRSQGRLGDLLRQAFGELGLPMKKFALPGALFDHIPFTGSGFDAVSLLTVGGASWAVHTPGDTADKLNPRGFEQAGQVALKVIEKLGSRGTTGIEEK